MSESTQQPRGRNRRRVIVASVVTILLATAVVLLVSALSSPDDPAPRVVLAEQEASMDLLGEAELAEASGETTEAIELLRRAVQLDSDNAAAVEALRRLEASANEAETGDSGQTPGGPPVQPGDSPDTGFLDPVDSVTLLVPTRVPGWVMDPVFGDDGAASATGEPTPETRESAERILVVVIDKETPEAAKAFLDKTLRPAYGVGEKPVTSDGVGAYFGTDGAAFANVSFVRGRYVFQMLFTSATGYPLELQDLAVEAAAAFPDELP